MKEEPKRRSPQRVKEQPDDPVGLPEAFLDRLRRILSPADFSSAVRSFSREKRTAFRVNTLRADRDKLIDSLRLKGLDPKPVPWVADAFSVPPSERGRLLDTEAYRENAIYIQNPSSMIPPMLLQPRSGELILDLAAAPGSKTHQMACMMGNRGQITAVEAVRARYYKLRDNMDALGASCVRPFFQDGTRTWRYRPEFFDRVLLDAPCSSEGRFRTEDAETTRYWSRRKITEMSRKQRRLLYSAIRCVKPGGTLVYSTCAFSPEENEMVVQKLLAKFAGALRIDPIKLDAEWSRTGLTEWDERAFVPEFGGALRIIPNELMDAFFICKMTKTAAIGE